MAEKGCEQQMNTFIASMQRQTRACLKDFVQAGLKTDDNFEKYFMNKTFESIKNTYKEFQRELQWDALSKNVGNNLASGKTTGPTGENQLKRARGDDVADCAKKAKIVGSNGIDPRSDPRNEPRTNPRIDLTDSHFPRADDSNKIKMRFCCLYCNFGGPAANEVYNHWKASHTGLIISSPFRFFTIGIARCFYCSAFGTYRSLLEHTKKRHSEQILVITNQLDKKKCGICHQYPKEMYAHFRTQHGDSINLIDPIWLNDQSLGDLLKIDVQRKENGNESTVNAGMIAKQLHTICGCCQEKIDTHQFLTHISNHPFEFTCTGCDFRTTDMNEIVAHETYKHSMDTFAKRSTEYSEWLMKQFLDTKIVFDNGLIVTNHNLRNTKYVDNFSTFVKNLLQSRENITKYSLKTFDVERMNSNKNAANLNEPKFDDRKPDGQTFREKKHDGQTFKEQKPDGQKYNGRKYDEPNFNAQKFKVPEFKVPKFNGQKFVDKNSSEHQSNGQRSTGYQPVGRQHNGLLNRQQPNEQPTSSHQSNAQQANGQQTYRQSSNRQNPNGQQSDVSSSAAELELRKQNELKRNICICDIPRTNDEDLDELVLNIGKMVDVPISLNDIVDVYRTNGLYSAIIVKFKSFELKERVVKAAHKMRLLTAQLIDLPPHSDQTHFFVNHHMTAYYRRMWDNAYKMRKYGKIDSVELNENGIIIHTKGKIKHVILTEAQLTDFEKTL